MYACMLTGDGSEAGEELWLFVHNQCYHSCYVRQHMKLVPTTEQEEASDIMTYLLMPHGELASHLSTCHLL